MPVRTIESKNNARLKELRQALSRPAASALAGIEGPHLLAEALRAGLHIKTVFVAAGAERLIESLPLPQQTEILVVPRPLLDAALTTEAPQPVAALIEPPDWTWAHVFSGSGRAALVIVLASLQDPGNLGTMIRSAEAFGATGIVSLPGTVSAWNPKAVRASAGSVFRVPVIAADERKCFGQLREAGMKVLTTSVRKAELDLDFKMTGPTALIIGNEGSGVPENLAVRADARITIPCPGPVESLNAAIAASVLLYEASRQRSEPNRRSAARSARGARR